MVSGEPPESQKQVLKLIEEKERIEREIEINGLVLKNNNIGFNEPLVDDEGFPRNDIDVRSVRLARNQINCLQNDLKNIIKAIDNGLATYFAERKDVPKEAFFASSSKMPNHMMQGLSVNEELKPFLVVNLVSENSPGFSAGIMVHDLITAFGSIHSRNFKDLQQIGDLVRNSQDHSIKVKIRRNGKDLEVILVPKVWSGQGLLGFKVAAIPN